MTQKKKEVPGRGKLPTQEVYFRLEVTHVLQLYLFYNQKGSHQIAKTKIVGRNQSLNSYSSVTPISNTKKRLFGKFFAENYDTQEILKDVKIMNK